MAREHFQNSNVMPVRIRLIKNRSKDPSVYNLPTASEIAALIVGDFTEENVMRDIIVDHKSNGLQRISDIHPSFMAMQYPLLFPYGEDGYQLGITYKNNSLKRKTKQNCMTIREYYGNHLHQRTNEAPTILRSERPFQQYVVDAYTCIEQERLRWIRSNQP